MINVTNYGKVSSCLSTFNAKRYAMNKALLIAFASLTLGACAQTVIPTFTAAGTPGYRLLCGGFFGDGDTGGCYEQAGKICGTKGYRVLQTGVSSLIIECKSDVPPNPSDSIQAR